MAKSINKLSAAKVSKCSVPGMYGDGVGLWLQVSKSGTKSWIYRYRLNGRSREMGLGPLHTIPLAKARDDAAICRSLVRDGIDPIEARKQERRDNKLRAAKAVTFSECAQKYIEAHKTSWRNAKHVKQWENTIGTYANSIFGDLPVSEVNTDLVMQCLEPIWNEKPETASRLRGRIESILSWATVRKYRTGENPARWRGHLDKLLPSPKKIKKVNHHSALPYHEINDFITALRNQEGIAARALELKILTATRTGEIIGAKWDEFNLKEKTWTIPAERMKARKEHRVPLSKRAITILKEMEKVRQSDYVFPSTREGKSLSNMALLRVLRRMNRQDITAHGFRSTFRDWTAEMTAYPREVAEMALAHTIGDKVEAAYRRGDLFKKRCKMMEAWADYCDTEIVNKNNVIKLNQ